MKCIFSCHWESHFLKIAYPHTLCHYACSIVTPTPASDARKAQHDACAQVSSSEWWAHTSRYHQRRVPGAHGHNGVPLDTGIRHRNGAIFPHLPLPLTRPELHARQTGTRQQHVFSTSPLQQVSMIRCTYTFQSGSLTVKHAKPCFSTARW